MVPEQARNCTHHIMMHSSTNGQWYGLLATLDPGTRENWISKAIVDRLRLAVTNGLVSRWTTFNGQQLASGSTVYPTWCSEGQGISHVTEFHVVSDGPFDVLLGRNILSSREVSGLWDQNGINPVVMLVPSNETVGRFRPVDRF